MTDFIQEAEHDIEAVIEAFKPRPGGIVDRFEQEKAKREAAARERENAGEPVEQAAYKSVKVTPLAPEVVIDNVITLQPQASQMLLPLSPYRYRATVIAVKGAGTGTVVLSRDPGRATSGLGFPLPPGIPMVIGSRAQLFAYNPDAANTVQVAVLAEIYAPESL